MDITHAVRETLAITVIFILTWISQYTTTQLIQKDPFMLPLPAVRHPRLKIKKLCLRDAVPVRLTHSAAPKLRSGDDPKPSVCYSGPWVCGKALD